MSAKNTSRDAPDHQSNDEPARRGQDGREAAQNDSSNESPNNPPNKPTYGFTNFLLWVGETGRSRDLDDLPDHYDTWKDEYGGTGP
jgi:hypothetical protein